MDDTYEPILLSRLLCHPNSLRTLNEDRIPELLGEIEALRVHLWSKLTTRSLSGIDSRIGRAVRT